MVWLRYNYELVLFLIFVLRIKWAPIVLCRDFQKVGHYYALTFENANTS